MLMFIMTWALRDILYFQGRLDTSSTKSIEKYIFESDKQTNNKFNNNAEKALYPIKLIVSK